jgi:DNA mismatch repair ATPase MutS
VFFLFIADDAEFIHNELGLKLTSLNETVVKCGFPINSLKKYSDMLQHRGFSFTIIDENSCHNSNAEYLDNTKIMNCINMLKSIDINHTSPIQAFGILSELKELLGD